MDMSEQFIPHVINEYYKASNQISTKHYERLLEAFNCSSPGIIFVVL